MRQASRALRHPSLEAIRLTLFGRSVGDLSWIARRLSWTSGGRRMPRISSEQFVVLVREALDFGRKRIVCLP